MNESITQQSAALHPYLDNLQRYALVVGLVGLAATAVGYFTDEEQFFRSYLLAFTFWIGLPLGSLGILMIHHVGGGTWGFSIRRLLEAGTRTLPLLFVLSLPILFLGLHDLYEWTHQNVVQKDSILQQKVSLSQRAVLYCPHRALLCDLGAVRLPAQPLVATAGPDDRDTPDPPHAGPERSGHRHFLPHCDAGFC